MKQEIMKPLKRLKHLTHSVKVKHQVQYLMCDGETSSTVPDV